MSWHEAPMLAFDTETTGTDPTEARIVSVCLAACEAGQTPQVRTWLLDPGVEIPAEAAAVHGITTEVARRDGQHPTEVIGVVVDALVDAWRAGHATVAMNASYDLTVLDAELTRHGMSSIAERRGAVPMRVVDPLVIDRHVARFRKGKKRLEDLCRAYAVDLDGAHTADGDALATARVAWRLARAYPDDLGCDLDELMVRQLGWHQRWAEDFEVWAREHVSPDTTIERDWPLRVAVATPIERSGA